MRDILPELIKLVPSLLWFGLDVSLLVLCRGQLWDLLARLGTFEAMGRLHGAEGPSG